MLCDWYGLERRRQCVHGVRVGNVLGIGSVSMHRLFTRHFRPVHCERVVQRLPDG